MFFIIIFLLGLFIVIGVVKVIVIVFLFFLKWICIFSYVGYVVIIIRF